MIFLNNILKSIVSISFALVLTMGIFFQLRAVEPAEFHSTIPVVDMNDYYNLERREAFIEQLRQAFIKIGFVAVINAGVDIKALDQGYETAIDFFRQDLETKLQIKCSLNSGERGYVTAESPRGGDDPSITDIKEFIHIGRELNQEEKLRLGYPNNIWPKDYPLKEPMMALFDSLQAPVLSLGEAISLAMGETASYIPDMIRDGDTLMRAIHYPANPPKAEMWAAAHDDITIFTILPRASSEGLQVQIQDGSWIDVVVPDNAIILNAGSMLQNLTNGYFRSSIHRVVAKDPSKERFSIVLFIHPRNQDDMSPRPELIEATGGIQRYPNATREELLWERIVEAGRATPERIKWLASTGIEDRLIDYQKGNIKTMRILKEHQVATPKVLEELERHAF